MLLITMIIQSLTLENIRSYSYVNFDFIEGITFLSGDIGSGKSSVLQGIEFALFGFKRGDLDAQQLLRRGSSKGSVSLRLRKENEIIEICRNLKKTKSGITQENGYIKTGDTLAELSPSQINAHVFELLNFPVSFINKDRHLIYRFCIYTPQEQLKEILFSEHDKRLEVIRKLFSIDKYKQLTNGIELYTKDLRDRKISLKAKLEDKIQIEQEHKELAKNLNNLSIEYNNIGKKLKPLQEEIKTLTNKREEKLEQLKHYQQKQIIIEKNLEKIESYEKRLGEIEEELKQISSIDIKELEEKKSEIAQKIEKKSFEIEEKKKQQELYLQQEEKLRDYLKKKEELDSLNEQLKKYPFKQDYQNLENQILKINEKLEKNNKIIEQEKNKQQEKEDLLERKSQINSKLEELESHKKAILNNDTCSLCRQQIPHTHKEDIEKSLFDEQTQLKEQLKEVQGNIKTIDEFFETLERAKKEHTQYNGELIQKKEQLSNIKNQLNEKQQIDDKKSTLEENLSQLKFETTSQEALKKQTKKFEEELEQLREHHSKLLVEQETIVGREKTAKESIEKKESLENKKEQLNQQLKKKSEIEEKKKQILQLIEDISKEQKHLQDSIEEKKPNLEELQAQLTQKKTQYYSSKEELEKYEKKQETIKSQEKELEDIQKQEYFLNQEAIPISSKVESKLFTKFYLIATQEFQRIFKELIEDQELDVRLNEEFSIIVEQNGHDIEVRQLSGGEKSSLAIAYKLALKKTIESFFPQQQYLDVLILDEPTDGFSAEQIQRLGMLLKDLNVEQILLVSHDEKIESIADRVIEIEKKNHESLRIGD